MYGDRPDTLHDSARPSNTLAHAPPTGCSRTLYPRMTPLGWAGVAHDTVAARAAMADTVGVAMPAGAAVSGE